MRKSDGPRPTQPFPHVCRHLRVGCANRSSTRSTVATFAGGCFWCTEADFDKVPGVLSTVSGYTGGKRCNPTYEQVSAGGTGHTEAVEVIYDPDKVSYEKLLTYSGVTSIRS